MRTFVPTANGPGVSTSTREMPAVHCAQFVTSDQMAQTVLAGAAMSMLGVLSMMSIV